MKLYLIIINITVMSVITFAQTYDDPSKFFPAKTGDMWEYFYYDSPYSDTLQTVTMNDSIDEQGTVFIRQLTCKINPNELISNNLYWIDTLNNVHGYYRDTISIIYKLASSQGTQWVIRRYSEHAFEMMRIDSVFELVILGNTTIVKKYRNYFAFDSTEISGIDRENIYLAYGFGLINWQGLEGNGIYYVKGLVINGVLFGDTTNVITSVFDVEPFSYVQDYNLYQNFPNPFNPTTTLGYSIPTNNFVTIKLYDVLGNEVITLVNEQKQAGKYEMLYNASNLASGVYYYQINAGDFTQTRKLMLMK